MRLHTLSYKVRTVWTNFQQKLQQYLNNERKKRVWFSSSATLPFSLQFILVQSEPRVRHFLGVAGKASPPADALPAGEAVSADGLAPLFHPLGGGAFPRHAAGELLQGRTEWHEGIHSESLAVVCGESGEVFPGSVSQIRCFICKYK